MLYRSISTLFAAVVATIAAPAAAAAQFTTFIAPPNRTADSVRAVVAADQRALDDSIARAQIVDMRTWVDSAAGVAITDRAVDSATVAALTEPRPVDTFMHGARAPATATLLPLLVVLGTAGIVLGSVLMRKPAPVRSGRRRRF